MQKKYSAGKLNKSAKERNWRYLIAFLFFGGLYYIWLRLTGICIPCMFRLVTGYKCPGCGITTMILRLSRLNFAGAFIANPFLFVTAPFLAAELIYAFIMSNRGERLPRWNTICLYIYCSLLLVFGVVRNLVGV